MIGFPLDSHITYDADGNPQFDRAITSEPYRKLLKELFKSGVMPTDSSNFQVVTDENMNVKVLAGFAMVDGCMKLEERDRVLAVQASESDLDRIDSVVLRLDDNDAVRICDLYVVKGTPSASPVHPELTREGSIYELGIADLFITHGSTQISASKITDTRYDNERCGVVSSISEFDTSTLDYQLNVWQVEQKAEFEAWVETIHDILDAETAGHLQNEIEAVDDKADAINTRTIATAEGFEPVPLQFVMNADGKVGFLDENGNFQRLGGAMQELDYSATIEHSLEGTTGTSTAEFTAEKDGVLFVTARTTSTVTAEVQIANAGSSTFKRVVYATNNVTTTGLECVVNRELPLTTGMKYKASRSATNGAVFVHLHFVPYA